MKSILKYLAVLAVLLVPVLVFPNRTSLVLLEYALTVLVVTSVVTSYWAWWVKGDLKQYTSWLVSLLVGFVPWLLNFGIFKPVVLVPELLIYVFLMGFVANGLYDLSWVKKILKWAGLLKTE